MNMPRSTAEASLYKASEYYQMTQVIAALRSEGAVVPQAQISAPQQRMSTRAPGDIVVECTCPCCICFGGICFCCF
jgi:hypothetical protein